MRRRRRRRLREGTRRRGPSPGGGGRGEGTGPTQEEEEEEEEMAAVAGSGNNHHKLCRPPEDEAHRGFTGAARPRSRRRCPDRAASASRPGPEPGEGRAWEAHASLLAALPGPAH